MIDIADVKVIEDGINYYYKEPTMSSVIATIEFTMTNNLEIPINLIVHDTNSSFAGVVNNVTVLNDFQKETSQLPSISDGCGEMFFDYWQVLPSKSSKRFKTSISPYFADSTTRLDHSKRYIVNACAILMSVDTIFNDSLYDGFRRLSEGRFMIAPVFELDFPNNIMRVVSQQYADSMRFKSSYKNVKYIIERNY